MSRLRPGRLSVPHRGWIVVAGAALVLAGAGGSRFSFGVFLRPLSDEFGWSRGSLSGALAVAALATGVGRLLGGLVVDRWDARIVSIVGLCGGGAALLGLSLVQELWQLYALFIAMAVSFTLASPTTITKMVSPWFQRRRSMALAVAHSGTAAGQMVLVPAAGVALVIWGWRASYVALGVLLFVLAPIVWRAVRDSSGQQGAREPEPASGQTGELPRRAAARALEGLPLRAALRVPMFWRLAAGFFA